MKFLAKILSTVFFVGYLPIMPGSFGSILGIFLYIFLLKYSFGFYSLIVLFLFLFGVFISDFAEKKIFKLKDPKEIVIDEIVGILVPFCGLSIFQDRFYLVRLIIIFFLFRLFDILKPYPIREVQKLDGGLGIMLDDIIAGVYTSILAGLIFRLMNIFVGS